MSVEHTHDLPRVDTRAGIVHTDHDLVVVQIGSHRDLAFRRREFHCIADDVSEDLTHACHIHRDQRQLGAGREVQCNVGLFRDRSKEIG